VVCAVRVLGNVHMVNFEPSDDLNFYLAAPEKMIETHWFAPDPFSERRVMTSVGGNDFLQTLILAELPLSSVGLAENGLGAILLLVMGLAIGREFELKVWQRYGFALLLMVTPQLRLNLTFVVLPSALFLGMVYLAAHRRLSEERPWLQGALLGGVAGAIATMKSTYITHAVVFVGCVFLLRWWKRGLAAGAQLLGMAALGCVVTMLPWMVASHAASGTWFFPVLGKGVHYSAYGQYPAPSSLTLHMLLYKVLPFNLPILAVFFTELLWGERDERSYTAMALTLAAFVGSTLVGLATGGDSVRRYNFPCILPALALCFVVAARRRNASGGERRWRWMEAGVFAGLLALAVNVGLSGFTREYERTLIGVRYSLRDYSITDARLRAEYAAMQEAIPRDGGVLASVTGQFLWNFRAHQVYIDDLPGTASPKPGWPARQPAGALAQYLLARHIRYLVVGYGECGALAPGESCAESVRAVEDAAISSPKTTEWARSELEAQRDAQAQFAELARTHRHIYDDGRIYVLDLAG
jgi:hypothetical protein